MKIADVMTPDLETVSPSDTLRTAARLMADVDSGALPVGSDSSHWPGPRTGKSVPCPDGRSASARLKSGRFACVQTQETHSLHLNDPA